MPTYSVECERCGVRLDIVCKMDERNVPKPCGEWVTDKDRAEAQKQEAARLEDAGAGAVASVPLARCDGQGTLVRPDALEGMAATPYAWRP